MNLKGDYNGLTTYDPKDVVRYTDGVCYELLKPCKAGVPPVDTLYWDRVPQPLQEACDLILDFALSVKALIPALANNLTTTSTGKALDARQGKALKTLIDTTGDTLNGLRPDSKTLVLASSTSESTKLMAITVEDDGTISAAEYTPPAEET